MWTFSRSNATVCARLPGTQRKDHIPLNTGCKAMSLLDRTEEPKWKKNLEEKTPKEINPARQARPTGNMAQ